MITKKQVDTNLSKEELLQMLAVKQNQINSLLEVTKAVNNNYSKHAIFESLSLFSGPNSMSTRFSFSHVLLRMENGYAEWSIMQRMPSKKLMLKGSRTISVHSKNHQLPF